ncbi:hypothetical protein LAZ67_13001485 [Cordylochernes scorpioides]|uniref:Uncharacterized protein n=1 Tax=Cordylochernes scorpioides TaxID=51811 RepID=A0ABY6L3W5_9ARAC|nr:hypothetical protein LAZ67_13001485 [Cordylochernes scorpioides]
MKIGCILTIRRARNYGYVKDADKFDREIEYPRDGWLRHTSRAFQIAVSSQVKFDEICPAPSLILMFVPSCSIMLIPAPPLLMVRSEDPSVYAIEGRGLAILIKNLYYEDIAVNITNTLDLEAQGIKKLAPRPKLAQLRKMLELQKG